MNNNNPSNNVNYHDEIIHLIKYVLFDLLY